MIESSIRIDEKVPRGKFCLVSRMATETAYKAALQETHDLPIRQLLTFDMVLIYSAQLAIEEWIQNNNPRSLVALVNPDDYEYYQLEDLLMIQYPEQVRASFSRNIIDYGFLLPRRR